EAMKAHVAMCAPSSDMHIGGFYAPEMDMMAVSPPNLKDDDLSASDALIFYEELWHAVQEESWKMGTEEKDYISGRHSLKDYTILHLGLEAHAKVGAALMILEHAEAGRTGWLDQILENIDS